VKYASEMNHRIHNVGVTRDIQVQNVPALIGKTAMEEQMLNCFFNIFIAKHTVI
jgi:hypothetical protein